MSYNFWRLIDWFSNRSYWPPHSIKYKTLSLRLSLICFIEVIIEILTGAYFQISIQEIEFCKCKLFVKKKEIFDD